MALYGEGRHAWHSGGLASPARAHAASIQHHYALLGHAARHEATDGRAEITAQRPHHRPASPVRFGDHGIVGNIDPFVVETDAVMAVPRFPIDIGNGRSIRERAAQALAGSKLVEPFISLGMAGDVGAPDRVTQPPYHNPNTPPQRRLPTPH